MNVLICLCRGLRSLLFQKSAPFSISSLWQSLHTLLSSNLNRGKPRLKTRSLEHISRVLTAPESFIKALTVTFNSNLRGTSNNDILLFFRQASRWHEQRVKGLLMENDIMVLMQVQIRLKIVLHCVGENPRLAPPADGRILGVTLVAAVSGATDSCPTVWRGGYDRVTAYGTAAREISPHQSEWRENLLTGSSPEPLHTLAHEIFNHQCWQEIGFKKLKVPPFISQVNAFSARWKTTCIHRHSAVCCMWPKICPII